MSQTPAVVAPAVPAWTCEFQALKSANAAPLNSLSVGTHFRWNCHGDIAVAWDQQPLHLVFPKAEDGYSLAILQVVRQDPNDVQLEVTAYKAGEHKPQFVRVMQGEKTGFEVAQPAWTVRSVLNPQQPAQPFASFGPWNLSLPVWFTVALALVLLALVYAVVRKLRRASQRRRMLEDLKRHATALLPVHQFYRDARQLRRRLHNAKDEAELKQLSSDLDREFRLYLLRQFKVPTLDWSDADILRELRRRHRKLYLAVEEPLKRTLRELGKLKGRGSVAAGDVDQLQRMSLETVEKIDSMGGRP
jgi:hypothetical protein